MHGLTALVREASVLAVRDDDPRAVDLVDDPVRNVAD
jgi:hypothetical protein